MSARAEFFISALTSLEAFGPKAPPFMASTRWSAALVAFAVAEATARPSCQFSKRVAMPFKKLPTVVPMSDRARRTRSPAPIWTGWLLRCAGALAATLAWFGTWVGLRVTLMGGVSRMVADGPRRRCGRTLPPSPAR